MGTLEESLWGLVGIDAIGIGGISIDEKDVASVTTMSANESAALENELERLEQAQQALDEKRAAEWPKKTDDHSIRKQFFEEQVRLEVERAAEEQRLVGQQPLDLATPLFYYGGLFAQHQQYESAEPFLLYSLAIKEQAIGRETPRLIHPRYLTMVKGLVMELYYPSGRAAEAEPLLKLAIDIQRAHLGLTHDDVGQTLAMLVGLYTFQDRCTEAVPLYQRALTILKKTTSHIFRTFPNWHKKPLGGI